MTGVRLLDTFYYHILRAKIINLAHIILRSGYMIESDFAGMTITRGGKRIRIEYLPFVKLMERDKYEEMTNRLEDLIEAVG